jgi:hypothetical protein
MPTSLARLTRAVLVLAVILPASPALARAQDPPHPADGPALAPTPPVGTPAATATGAPAAAVVMPVADPPRVKPSYLFYRPEVDYGTARQFSPLSVVLNRGFSTLVWQGAERRPLHMKWRNGWGVVWGSLAHPDAAVERRGGWNVWAHDELGPFSWDPWGWMFASNYAGHTVAGGITYRMLSEWYDHHGVPAPRVFAGATVMGSILVNEAVEGQKGGPGAPSTVADVYLFEPLGIAAFSIDAIARLFSTYLHADDWSPQATVTLPDLQLENVAQLMSYHFALPFVKRLDFLALIGQGSQFGLLYDLSPEYSLGASTGFVANSRLVDAADREHVVARLTGGFYLTRHNSLLGSLSWSRGTEMRSQLSVYPGVLGNVGGWAAWRRSGQFSVGLTALPIPGLGLGYDSQRWVPQP